MNRPADQAVQPRRLRGNDGGARRAVAAVVNAHRRVRRRRRTGATLVTSGLGLVAALALLAVLAVMPFDGQAIEAVKATGLPARWFMAAITDVGKSQWYLVPAGIVFLVSAAADWTLRNRRGKARLARAFGQSAFVFAAVALSGIAVNIVKLFFGRSRPVLLAEDGPWHFEPFASGYAHASFPSGHSTTVGALTAILFIWFPRWRWLTGPLGLFAAATRIAALAHYPSDVIAGFFFGFLFALVLARWLAVRGVVFRLSAASLFPLNRSRSRMVVAR